MKFNSSFCINIYTNFNKNALRHKFAKRKQKKIPSGFIIRRVSSS